MLLLHSVCLLRRLRGKLSLCPARPSPPQHPIAGHLSQMPVVNIRDRSAISITDRGFGPMHVLVVEDFAPFRQLIRSMLAKRPHLQIIAEVSDGLEAVHQAAELKPELILLDIGLPKLNGIDAAGQIHKLSPESKILFLSQESSPYVVLEALNSGASGYVVKTRAASDLLAAVEAVGEGGQFVSGGLSRQYLTHADPAGS